MRRILFALIALMSVVIVPVAMAQSLPGTSTVQSESIELPSPLTKDAVDSLIARLSDQEVRALLLEQLDAVATEQGSADQKPFLTVMRDGGTKLLESWELSLFSIPRIIEGVPRGIGTFAAPRGWSGVGYLIGVILLAIALGLVAEWVINRIAHRWRSRFRNETPQGLAETLGLLLRRVLLDAVGLVAFYVVTREVAKALLSSTRPVVESGPSFPDLQIALFFIWNVIIIPRIIRTLIRFLSAPTQPSLRLVHTDDWTAKFLYFWMTVVFVIWGIMGFIIPFFASHGLPIGQMRLGFWLNLAAYLTIFWTIWRARDGLTMMLIGKDEDVTPSERWVAQKFPYVSMALVAATYLLIQILVSHRAFGLTGVANITMVILLFTPTFDTMVRGLVKHLAPPMTGSGIVAEEAYQKTRRSYIRIGRVIVAVLIILLIARLWRLDLSNLAAGGFGARAAGRFLEVTMILLSGYLVWELISLWINRKLAAEQTAAGFDLTDDEPGGGEGGAGGGSRLSTILPLLLGTLKVAIAVIFGLIALGTLGIDTTPLLAGAGIVGLAIGFGAQKLVADVVSGVFFLVDDAFRTGEYVDVEGTVGTVENISIRSMQLRHHKGAVHTIPYGEIPKLTNYSRDWVIMKLKFTVPFETDPNKIKKIFKQIGKDMQAVPEFAEDMIQPFKSQGVFDFDDVGMIIRGKFMAKPGKQFTLRKEIFNRVKAAFEASGIPFARREVRVAIPGLEDAGELTDEQKSAVAAAASHAAQTPPGNAPT